MVTLIKKTSELELRRGQEKKPVGFVPTMGNLHQGHLSLFEKALSEFEVVYFSIFVNPKQFGPHEDFNKYPRTLDNDLLLIQKTLNKFPKSEVVVFAPAETSEVFPPDSDQVISVEGLSHILEGEVRPGHFDGVATVVHRLFQLVRPTKAYFGLKDYQQYLVIKKMVKDLMLPVDVVGMPTIREESGLALSSRNQYLTDEEKVEALTLSKSMKKLASLINHKKENIQTAMGESQKIKEDRRWNYLEIRDAVTLSEDISESKKIAILGVFQLRETRLLDNLQVELQ